MWLIVKLGREQWAPVVKTRVSDVCLKLEYFLKNTYEKINVEQKLLKKWDILQYSKTY